MIFNDLLHFFKEDCTLYSTVRLEHKEDQFDKILMSMATQMSKVPPGSAHTHTQTKNIYDI